MKTRFFVLFLVLFQIFAAFPAMGRFEVERWGLFGKDHTTSVEESDLRNLLGRIAPETLVHFDDPDDLEFFLNSPVPASGHLPEGTTVHTMLSLMVLADKSGNPRRFSESIQYYHKQGYAEIFDVIDAFAPQGASSGVPMPSTAQDLEKAFQTTKIVPGLPDKKDVLMLLFGLKNAMDILDKCTPAAFAVSWSGGTINTGIKILEKWNVDSTAAQIAAYKILFYQGKIRKLANGSREVIDLGEGDRFFDATGWLVPSLQHPADPAPVAFWDYVDFMLWLGASYGNSTFQTSFGNYLTAMGSSGNPEPAMDTNDGGITTSTINNLWLVDRGHSVGAYVTFGEGLYSRCKKVRVRVQPEGGTEAPTEIQVPNPTPSATSAGFVIPSLGSGQTTEDYTISVTITYDRLNGSGDSIGEFSVPVVQPISVRTSGVPVVAMNLKPLSYPASVQCARGGTVWIPLEAQDQDGSVVETQVVGLPSASVVGSGNRVAWKNYFKEVKVGGEAVLYQHNGDAGSLDSFTFAAIDDRGSMGGVAQVVIHIVESPSNPLILTQPYVIQVETGKSVPVKLKGGSTVSGTVTRTVTSLPAAGQVTQVISGSDEHLVYTAPTTTGNQTLTYRIQDGVGNQKTETVTIQVVAPVPHAPVASNIAASVAPGKPVAFKLKASDVDGGTLTYQIISSPSYGSISGTAPNLTYTHAAANGLAPDRLEYKVTDPTGRSDTAFVNIHIVNTAPVIGQLNNLSAAVGQAVSMDLSATDAAGQVLSFHLAAGTPGTINSLNRWTHTFSAPGAYTVTILVRDRATAGSPVLSESQKSFTVIVGGYAEFTDVPSTHPQYTLIHDAAHTRGVVGYTEGTSLVFRPDQAVTRGEFMTMLLKYSGVPVDTSGTPFPDVPSTHTHFTAIQTFKNKTVVVGYHDGDFGPDNYLTRQELAVIFTGVLRWGWGDFPVAPFVDVPVPAPSGITESQWAPIYNAICQLKEHGLTSDENLNYRPFDNATRLEAVIMLSRYLGLPVTTSGDGILGSLSYSDNGTSVTITKCDTSATDTLDIPETINGKPVTSIGYAAFNNCSGLTSVTIPSSVTSIDAVAFANCSGLTSVTIPSSVTSIGAAAFSSCSGLTEIIVASGNPNYSSLDGVLFNKLKTALIQFPKGNAGAYAIPSSVVSIEAQAFNGCRLTSVTIPSSVTSIGSYAFQWCSGLTSVTIPSSVTSIGTCAFYGCYSLTSMTIPSSVTSIGSEAFGYCGGLAGIAVDSGNPNYSSLDGVLFNKLKTTLIQFPGAKAGTYVIASSVTSIGSAAFYGCDGLTSVTIPASVTSIGNYAFYWCGGLTSVTIPVSVTSIGDSAFILCDGLTEIAVASGNPNYSSLDGVLFNKIKTTLIQCPGGKTGAYVIPASVTSIGNYAFDYCRNLTSVTIPASVTSIGNYAFINCQSLLGAVFLGNAPSLGNLVFASNASSFRVYYDSANIGFSSPTWQGYPAVAGFPVAPVASTGNAAGVTANSASLSGTVNPNGFATAAYFEYGPTATYGSSVSVTLNPTNGTAAQGVSASIYGLGPGETYHYRLVAANAGGTSTGEDQTFTTEQSSGDFKYTVANGMVTITGYTGSGGAVVIPESIGGMPVVGIGASVFHDNTAITSITIPATVTHIGNLAFYACQGLKSITIPSSVISIGDWTFGYCNGLTSVTIPSSVTSIGTYAFYGCYNLTGAIFAGNAPTVGTEVFSNTASAFTIYYDSANSGFTSPTWQGYPSVAGFPEAPLATTGNVADVTANSAILSGTVNPNGFGTAAYFEYGPTTTYGTTVPVTLNPTNGTDAQGVSASVDGLGTGVTYHYRLVATNAGGTSTGDDQTFSTEQSSGDFKYTVANGSVTITGYTGAGGDVVIAESVGGMPVVGIGASVFYGNTAITSVTIPATVTKIGNLAFYACQGLVSVTIPSSVISLGDWAFGYCNGLTSVTIPSSVTSIGFSAFYGCYRLTGAIFLGNAPSMGSDVFRYAASGFTVYYDSANSGFTSPTWQGYPAVAAMPVAPVATTGKASEVSGVSASLGGSVNPNGFTTTAYFEFGPTAAYGSSVSVTLSEPNGSAVQSVTATLGSLTAAQTYHYRLVATNAGGSATGDDQTFTTEQISGDFKYTVANGSVTITGYTGPGGAVVIPESIGGMPVVGIGANAFQSQTSIISAIIPTGVTSIGPGAFSNCFGLISVTIPSSVASIGYSAFYNCYGLTAVSIPSSVSSIGDFAFAYCGGLSSVRIPPSLTSIGNNVFYGCYSLTGAIFEGDAPSMGTDVFAYTASAFTIYYDSANSGFTSPTWQGYPAVAGFPEAPLATTGNASNVSAGFATLSGSVNPNGFGTTARFEFGLTTDYGTAVSIALDPSNGTAAQNVSAAIGGLETGQTYHYRLVATNAGGTSVGEDRTFTTEQSSGDFKYTIANNAVTITDYTGTGGAVVIPASIGGLPVVGIGMSAFMSNHAVTSVSIPNGLVTIDNWAFASCGGLLSVTIPSSVTSIGYGAFYGCASLTGTFFEGNAPSMGIEAFAANATGFTAYFIQGATGFTTPTWEGYPSVALVDAPEIAVEQPTGADLATGDNLDFGSVILDGSAVMKTFTITNAGGRSLTGLVVSATGTHAADFQITQPAATALAPLGSTTFTVSFAPSASGTRFATLQIASNDANENPFTVALGGTGGQPPTVTTGPAQWPAYYYSYTTLTGTVNPNGYATTVQFEYGPTTAYGAVKTVTLSPDNGNADQSVTVYLSNLLEGAGATYHYRLTATNANGTTNGEDRVFVTTRTSGDYTYMTSDSSATITGYSGAGGAVTIPSTLNGLAVTEIGYRAFDSKTAITSVTIPNSVTRIGDLAFWKCDGLTSITIPNSVTSIGDYAFYDCAGLISMMIPDSVTAIGDNAFYLCEKLASVTIPASVTSIGKNVFYRCGSLASITVNTANPNYSSLDGVLFNKTQTNLIQCPGGKAGFYLVPASVTSIEDDAFFLCTGLVSISVNTANPNYSSLDGVLFNKTQTTLIQCPGGKAGFYSMPASVTSVGGDAFYGCNGLTSVTMPNSVTSIGDRAFAHCTGLNSVVISNGITSIGDYIFYKCANLTSVIIPNSVTRIGDYAFSDCTGLTSVIISDSATSIGYGAFSDCDGLTYVTIPNSVTNIEREAFSYCDELKSVAISNRITSIGNDAFFACGSLRTALFYGNAPGWAPSVFDGAATGFTVYYLDTATGFTSPTWQGYPAIAITNGVWGNTLGGSWSDASNWLGNATASGVESTADFSTLDFATNIIVTVDGSRTIGGLKFGDASPSHNLTLSAGTGGAITLQMATGRPIINVANQTTMVSAVLAGTQGFEKTGGGTLVLSGSNIFSGLTVVSGGKLSVSNANALGGVAQGTQVATGTALEVQGGITLAAEPITLSGTGISGAGALRSVSGYNTVTGAINLTGAARISSDQSGRSLTLSNSSGITGSGFDLVIGGVGNTVVNGPIATGAATFTKDGAGTVQFTSTANSVLPTNVVVNQGILELSGMKWIGDSITGAGVITVNSAGTLRISSPHALGGSNSGFGEKIILNGGTLTLNSEQYLSDLELSGATVNGTNEIRTPSTSPSFKVTGTSPSNVAARISHSYSDSVWTVGNVTGNADADLLMSGPMVGSFGLTKTGSGTMVLTGTNSFTGTTTITQGVLQIGNGSTTGTLSTSNVIINGTFVFNRSNTVTQGADFGDLSGAGSVVKLGTGTLVINRNNSYGGNTTVTEGILQINDGAGFVRGVTNNATMVFQLGGSMPQSSAFRGNVIAGSGALVKKGLGMLLIDRANSYTGPTTISDGSLALSSSGALSVNSTITNNGTFLINRSGDTQQGTHFSGSPITGSGRLEKRGSGTLTLTAANTYTGETTVLGGTLKVAGNSIPDTGRMTLTGGKVELPSGVTEIIGTMYFGTVQQARGTWGSSQSAATHKDDNRFFGTGVLIVTSGPLDYAEWAATNSLGQTAEQDHDYDGVANGIEYFMGQTGNGFTANPALINGTVTWPKSSDFVGTFAVQTTTDLNIWTDVTTDPTQITTTTNSVIWTRPAGAETRFVRLVVTPQQ